MHRNALQGIAPGSFGQHNFNALAFWHDQAEAFLADVQSALQPHSDPSHHEQRGDAVTFGVGDLHTLQRGQFSQGHGVLETGRHRGAQEVRAQPAEIVNTKTGGSSRNGLLKDLKIMGRAVPRCTVHEEQVDDAVEALIELRGQVALPPAHER